MILWVYFEKAENRLPLRIRTIHLNNFKEFAHEMALLPEQDREHILQNATNGIYIQLSKSILKLLLDGATEGCKIIH